MTRISTRFRLALAAKALLLLSLAVAFEWLAVESWHKPDWHVVARASGLLLCGIATLSLAWAAIRGLADAALGQALSTPGAKPLKSRRSGYSLRLPDGKFVEYVLYNPWSKLVAEQQYTVTYGRYSRVLVAPPVADA